MQSWEASSVGHRLGLDRIDQHGQALAHHEVKDFVLLLAENAGELDAAALARREHLHAVQLDRQRRVDVDRTGAVAGEGAADDDHRDLGIEGVEVQVAVGVGQILDVAVHAGELVHRREVLDRKSTRLNSSHVKISYAVFCLKKKKRKDRT